MKTARTHTADTHTHAAALKMHLHLQFFLPWKPKALEIGATV